MDNGNKQWSENVIIVDGDFVDKVAFDLTVNFERMLERRIPKADTARWIDCIALDGGLREGEHETQVVLIHRHQELENFSLGNYANELSGKAFRDNLGEFAIAAYEQADIEGQSLMVEAVSMAAAAEEVKRLMIVPDEREWDDIRHALRHADDEKRVTLFAMQPMTGGNFRQEILGYSLMSALGIRGEEVKGEN